MLTPLVYVYVTMSPAQKVFGIWVYMVTLLTLISLALITVTVQSCVQMQQLAARYNKSLCQQYKKECSSLVLTCMLFVLAQSGYTV